MKNIPQKEGKKQPKIKTEMNGKGLTVHAGLLPVLTFMEKLLFRKRVQEAVRKERGANAQYRIVDAMQMIVIGLIAGATSMVQIVKVWGDEVLMKLVLVKTGNSGMERNSCRYHDRAYYEAGNPGGYSGTDWDNP